MFSMILAFALGAIFGFVVMASLAINKEDKNEVVRNSKRI